MAEPTFIKVTGAFERADKTPATGTITATLSGKITNGELTIEPTPILGELNNEGKLIAQSGGPFELAANDDPATLPVGTTYSFVVKLDNAPVREFDATVKHAAVKGEVTLTELEAQ